jgi:hypothetical protein
MSSRPRVIECFLPLEADLAEQEDARRLERAARAVDAKLERRPEALEEHREHGLRAPVGAKGAAR